MEIDGVPIAEEHANTGHDGQETDAFKDHQEDQPQFLPARHLGLVGLRMRRAALLQQHCRCLRFTLPATPTALGLGVVAPEGKTVSRASFVPMFHLLYNLPHSADSPSRSVGVYGSIYDNLRMVINELGGKAFLGRWEEQLSFRLR